MYDFPLHTTSSTPPSHVPKYPSQLANASDHLSSPNTTSSQLPIYDNSLHPLIPNNSNLVPRRSLRTPRPPTHLSDCICNLVSFSTLPNDSQVFLAKQSQWHEPKSYKDAATKTEWQIAMQKELQALDANNTWELVPLPSGKKAICSKWVYKVKLKSDGTLERHKARLVAKGYHQQHGFDFQEAFSPVVRLTMIRCLIALAVSCNWPLYQLDVNSAFLHGDLHEDVYMTIPEGMTCVPHMVCKLKKSL